MLRYLIILLLPLTLFSQTEEKRLALVIGNSNYDKGPLNNPVNDALLMAQTLDSLDFDVILDTNIANKENFIRTIREFGNKRSDYDVAFVYYAGHGIQVGAENFLLPTKVNFETEYDVMDFGVSVQNIMRYLTGMTNQVNILVLDACRDNPFEGNWNKTRSLKGGGLAKIPPPTGSLIAFSTDAGNTAADGDGDNSIYCKSLCRNMMLENISLDQVFRNVRSDVLSLTDANQRPVESSQLTGEVYYLNPSNNPKNYEKINNYLLSNKLDSALFLLNAFVDYFPNDKVAFTKLGHIYHIKEDYEKAKNNYFRALNIDSSYVPAMIYFIESKYGLYDLGLAQLLPNDGINYLNKIVKEYPNEFIPNIYLGRELTWSEKPLEAISVFMFVDSLQKNNALTLELEDLISLSYKGKLSESAIRNFININLGYAYIEAYNDSKNIDFIKLSNESFKLVTNNDEEFIPYKYKALADNYVILSDLNNAEAFYSKAILAQKRINENSQNMTDFLYSRGLHYIYTNNYDNAIKDFISTKNNSLKFYELSYFVISCSRLTQIYLLKGELINALQSINESIFHLENSHSNEIILEYLYLYQIRAYIFNLLNEKDLACEDLNTVNESDSNYSYDLEDFINKKEFKIICY